MAQILQFPTSACPLPNNHYPAEETILRPAYDKYCASHQRWHWKDGEVMSFDTWWRAMADNIKDNREGK